MNNWREKSYLKNIQRRYSKIFKDILNGNTNLPRCYSLTKVHKESYPLRIIACIDCPLSQLSDMYQNIISTACKKPSHVV